VTITWTETQIRRLNELDASESELDQNFVNESDREQAYQQLDKKLVTKQRQRLKEFREIHMRPALCRLESKLIDVLVKQGFAQVTTPIMMSRGLLKKMAIDAHHPLNSQIYWLDKNKCLRPMLRKESHGAQHSSEFTMLNLVEMGLPSESREDRIRELGKGVAEVAGVNDYRFDTVKSEIYGDTLDLVAGEDNTEIGSAAMGPHPLDRPWKINETWIGIGFGLERLLMTAENTHNLAKFGRSLSYLDGIRLNL
jgi:phenylalanyl-tRNA synthetase alpha chain